MCAIHCAERFPGDLIEIGCLTGETTRLLCRVAAKYDRRVVCVDPWEAGTQNCTGDEYDLFLQNTQEYRHLTDIIRASSQEPSTIQQIKSRQLSFAFVDGLHMPDACASDIKAVSHCNGIVCVDDLLWSQPLKARFIQTADELSGEYFIHPLLREGYLWKRGIYAG